MLERLIIAVILMGIGALAYRFWCVRQLRQVPQQPLFNGFEAGKPAIVLFTADYCMPCRYQQQPAIQRLMAEMRDLQLIQVDVQQQPEVAEAWRVMSLPTTFVLDAQGTPRSINPGVTPMERLRQQVQALAV